MAHPMLSVDEFLKRYLYLKAEDDSQADLVKEIYTRVTRIEKREGNMKDGNPTENAF